MKTSSKSRLVRNGQRQTAPEFGSGERHSLTIGRLAIECEEMLGACFDPRVLFKAFLALHDVHA